MKAHEGELCYKKSTQEVISEIKRHLLFIDETFTIASSVRQRTEVKPLQLLEDIVLPGSEKTLIQSEMRSIKRELNRKRWQPIKDERYINLARKLKEAEQGVKFLKSVYSRTMPLSPKLVVQYTTEKHLCTMNWLNLLCASEQNKVKVIRDGQLIDYVPGVQPEQEVKLHTQLKPYFSDKELSADIVLSHLDTIKQKLQKTINNTSKSRQHLRRKQAEYKYRKLNHFISVVNRLDRFVTIYGKSIKGVKSYIKLNEQLFSWPQYLVGKFEPVRSGLLSLNRSILSEHTVIIPASGEVPIVSFDTLHIFCKDSRESLGALKQLSPHELNKFQAFNHYEVSMSKEYPLKNSIEFPYR